MGWWGISIYGRFTDDVVVQAHAITEPGPRKSGGCQHLFILNLRSKGSCDQPN